MVNDLLALRFPYSFANNSVQPRQATNYVYPLLLLRWHKTITLRTWRQDYSLIWLLMLWEIDRFEDTAYCSSVIFVSSLVGFCKDLPILASLTKTNYCSPLYHFQSKFSSRPFTLIMLDKIDALLTMVMIYW